MTAWHPLDLSASGLALTLGHGMLALACFHIGAGQRQRPARWWRGLGIVLLVIAAERQLGLLDGLASVMRAAMEVEGDYAARRTPQAVALVGVALVTLIGGGITVWRAASAGGRIAAMTALVTAMVAYRLAKAVSFHVVDTVLFHRIGGIAIGNAVEVALVAAALVVVALAWRAGRGAATRE